MQKLKQTNKESGKANLALLIAITLTAGAAGVWSELQAQATVTKTASSSISVNSSSAWGSISSQPNGTAWVNVQANVGGDWVNGSDSANTTFALSVKTRGQSGQPGSGTGSAILAGTSWLSGPVLIGVDLSVQGANNVNAFNNHNLQVSNDGATAWRVTQIGSSAWGNTAGSISITVNGSPFASATGVSGQVQEYKTHVVEKVQ